MSEIIERVADYQSVPNSLAEFIADLQEHYSSIPEEHRTTATISFDRDSDYGIYYERPKTPEELKEDEARANDHRNLRIKSALRILKELNYKGDLNVN